MKLEFLKVQKEKETKELQNIKIMKRKDLQEDMEEEITEVLQDQSHTKENPMIERDHQEEMNRSTDQ